MGEPLERARRHRAIESLVRQAAYSSQEELARALERQGFEITQGTLSRDLKALRIARTPTGEGYRYAPTDGGNGSAPQEAAGERRMRTVATLEVTGLDSNETGVVVRTLTGRAQGVAVYLDALHLPDVLGTIAGDDTILVLPRSVKRTARLRGRLARALGLEP